jgi:hypothetical protein
MGFERLDPQKELPAYRCHQVVRAGKIVDITDTGVVSIEKTWDVEPGFQDLLLFTIGMAFVHEHHPVVGGYLLVWDDGDMTFCLARDFERSYTRVGKDGML